jgi:hypothetical protein
MTDMFTSGAIDAAILSVPTFLRVGCGTVVPVACQLSQVSRLSDCLDEFDCPRHLVLFTLSPWRRSDSFGNWRSITRFSFCCEGR